MQQDPAMGLQRIDSRCYSHVDLLGVDKMVCIHSLLAKNAEVSRYTARRFIDNYHAAPWAYLGYDRYARYNEYGPALRRLRAGDH